MVAELQTIWSNATIFVASKSNRLHTLKFYLFYIYWEEFQKHILFNLKSKIPIIQIQPLNHPLKINQQYDSILFEIFGYSSKEEKWEVHCQLKKWIYSYNWQTKIFIKIFEKVQLIIIKILEVEILGCCSNNEKWVENGLKVNKKEKGWAVVKSVPNQKLG